MLNTPVYLGSWGPLLVCGAVALLLAWTGWGLWADRRERRGFPVKTKGSDSIAA